MSKSINRTPRKNKPHGHTKTDLAPDKGKKLAIISFLETNKPVSYSDRETAKPDSQRKKIFSSSQRKSELTSGQQKGDGIRTGISTQHESESDPSVWNTSEMGARLEICVDMTQDTKDESDSFVEENEDSVNASLTSFGSVTSIDSRDYSEKQTHSHTARSTTDAQTRVGNGKPRSNTSTPWYGHRLKTLGPPRGVTKDGYDTVREKQQPPPGDDVSNKEEPCDLAVSYRKARYFRAP